MPNKHRDQSPSANRFYSAEHERQYRRALALSLTYGVRGGKDDPAPAPIAALEEIKTAVSTLTTDLTKKSDDLKTSFEDLTKNLNAEVNTVKTELAEVKKASIKVDDGVNLPLYNTSLKAFKSPKLAHSFGMLMFAAIHDREPKFASAATAYAAKWCKEHLGVEKAGSLLADFGIEKAGQQLENTNTIGGNLVVEQTSSEVIRLVEEYGVFRAQTRIIPMTSDEFSMPRRIGGATASFIGEAASLPTGAVTWNRIKLVAKKAAIMIRWSSEIAEDAVISIADFLAMEIAYGFSYFEDQCGFIGDATSTYGGITGLANACTATTSIFQSATGNTGFETIDLEDCIGVVAKLPKYAMPGAKWYISSYGFAAMMMRLKFVVGSTPAAAAAGAGNTVQNVEAGGLGMSFLGFPIVISQVLNSTSGAQTSTQIAWLGNLPLASKMGVRRGVQVQTSTERYFDTDELAIRGIERFDVTYHDQGAIVALKTAGS